MRKPVYKFLVLAFAITLASGTISCRRQHGFNTGAGGESGKKPQNNGQTQPGESGQQQGGSDSQNPPPSDVGANFNVSESEGVTTKDPDKCYDRNAKIIPGQFQDKSKNQTPQTVNCYDQAGNLVYPGSFSGTCFDELRARYGAQIIYPIQNILPETYAQALRQPPGTQERWLLELLRSQPCEGLR